LLLAGQPMLKDLLLEPAGPALVVGARQIEMRREHLLFGARHVDVPESGRAHEHLHRERAPLPVGMKHRLVRRLPHFADAMHAPHVMAAVHRALPGSSGRPVPIMELRVTRFASLSSLQPSVPAGRSGTTMYRVSAVESQTRMSVSGASATPKSRSTPRGSLTARER